ncbi:uncharacterized protein LOC124162677 [Ischnura elegans]|uniref:uncharacterized protein LOC124162677 n=1 Tax=Ischnura elegans TaxID=197161 RepID=UPI001ED8AF98|nr:uncharacterized protein LOC124162677 [Ischnura elegans]
MCTQQLSRQRQKAAGSKSWQEMFPNPQLSEQSSATFLKKLVAIAISNITYLRNIFPEAAFADRSLEGLNLKVLRDDGSFPAVSQLIRWIKGSFEALDRRFLRQLIIGIYNDPTNPNDVLETYSFHFSYTNKTLSSCSYYQNDGQNKREITTENFVSAEETFRQTISLFRHCLMCTHSLKPLPQDSLINMRLLYYDDVTPENYEPPGFKPSPVSAYTFVNNPILLNLGETKTPWHGMKLLLATDASDFEVAAETSPAAEKTNSDSQQEMKSTPQPGTSTSLATPLAKQFPSFDKSIPDSQNAVVPTTSPAQPASAVSTTGSSWAEPIDPQGEEVRIRCPCGSTVDTGLLMICFKCRLWQHANCFKILTEDNLPQRHICELCDTPSSPCTDTSLPAIMPNERKEICFYRRALGLCSESYRIGEVDLVSSTGMDSETASSIMKKLDKEGAFKMTNKKSKGKFRLVNKPDLKRKVLPNYFFRNAIPEESQPLEETGKKSSTPPTLSEMSTEELPQDIEVLAQKLSLSHSMEHDGKTDYPPQRKGKKRLMLHSPVKQLPTVEEEQSVSTKKRFKASVPEDYCL